MINVESIINMILRDKNPKTAAYIIGTILNKFPTDKYKDLLSGVRGDVKQEVLNRTEGAILPLTMKDLGRFVGLSPKQLSLLDAAGLVNKTGIPQAIKASVKKLIGDKVKTAGTKLYAEFIADPAIVTAKATSKTIPDSNVYQSGMDRVAWTRKKLEAIKVWVTHETEKYLVNLAEKKTSALAEFIDILGLTQHSIMETQVENLANAQKVRDSLRRLKEGTLIDTSYFDKMIGLSIGNYFYKALLAYGLKNKSLKWVQDMLDDMTFALVQRNYTGGTWSYADWAESFYSGKYDPKYFTEAVEEIMERHATKNTDSPAVIKAPNDGYSSILTLYGREMQETASQVDLKLFTAGRDLSYKPVDADGIAGTDSDGIPTIDKDGDAPEDLDDDFTEDIINLLGDL